MADLSTLDETQPEGVDPANEGDDHIRETREAIKTSFGSEHDLAGTHEFPRGTTAARPAAGHDGRIFLNTQRERIERDDGVAWNMLNAVQQGLDFTAGSLGVIGATWTTLKTVAFTDLPPGSRVLCLASVYCAWTGSTDITLDTRIRLNGATVLNPATMRHFGQGAGNSHSFQMYAHTSSPGTTPSFTFEAIVIDPVIVNVTAFNAQLLCLVY